MELFKQYASGKEKPKLEMMDRDIEKVKQSPYTRTRWIFSKDMKYIIHTWRRFQKEVKANENS